ncbi:hypothetical protein [Mycobacteroides abscessus]|uniref:hypothetical protein n=1 Tax=Mycobacteroides abscessus TaxID=36809 RepID=UPI000C25B622|nr:hypothetical protein [Mycobacteroides abscessus]
MSLNDEMQFDRIIRVNPDGTVTDSPRNDHFDGVSEVLADDGRSLDRIEGLPAGWKLLRGWTGQHGYNGVLMHTSEVVGGGLEKHILETPGDYVCLIANGIRENDTAEQVDEHRDEDTGYGWWIAYRPLED